MIVRQTAVQSTILCALALGAAACSTTPPAPPPPSGGALAAACPAETFAVYFARDQVDLDDLSNQVIERAAQHIAGCSGGVLEVAGFADSVGDPATNQRISAQRATAVYDALVTRGVAAAQVRVLAVGEEGARTEDGVAEPMRRRVDVNFVPAGL